MRRFGFDAEQVVFQTIQSPIEVDHKRLDPGQPLAQPIEPRVHGIESRVQAMYSAISARTAQIDQRMEHVDTGWCIELIACNNHVVFDVGGNKFRIVVLTDYARHGSLIRFVGTHEQYDAIKDIEHIRDKR